MRALALAALSLALGGLAWAQELPPLGLDELLASLDGRHPQVAAALADTRAAEAGRTQARGAYDLQLDAQLGAVPLGEYTWSKAGGSVSQLTPLWGAELSAGWSWGDGYFPSYYDYLSTDPYGETWAALQVPLLQDGAVDKARTAVRVADQELLSAQAALRAVEIGVERAATITYWRWVAAGRRLEIAEELLRIAAERDAAIAERVRVGDLPQLDRLDNERIIVERQARRADAQRQLAQAELDLALYLRDAEGRRVLATAGRLPPGLPPPANPAPLLAQDLVALALQARPELVRLDAKLTQAELKVRLYQNQRAPTLDLKAEVREGLGGDTPTELSGGLAFELPVQRRVATGELQAAEAEQARLLAERAWAVDRITTEVERAAVALDNAWLRWQAAARSAELARALEEAEQARFDLGDSDLLRVYQREQIFADAALAELDARLEVHLARAELAAAAATPLGG